MSRGVARAWTASAVMLLITVLSGGCAVDQDREVAAYRQVINIDADPVTDDAPLTLRAALLAANQYNEQLGIEGEQYLRTLIERRRAVAEFLPTIDLVGRHVRRDRTDGGNGGSSSQHNTFDLSADLAINVFNGFSDVHRYWRDTFRIAQQRNDLLAFQEAMLLDVARVYYEVLRSEELVRVLVGSLEVQEERLRDARGRFEAGLARPLDVAQTEAQASATRATLIDARRAVSNARSLLHLLTRLSMQDRELTDRYDLPEAVESPDAYLAAADDARRELAAAAAAVEAARHDVEVAIGQYYPSVSIDFSAFLYRETAPDERAWDGLLVANLPLFAAGRIHADVREAWSFYRQALLVQSFLQRQVHQQVEQAYQDFTASKARLDELRINVAAAEQAFQQAEASYRAGLGTNLERIAAQDTLLEAQLQYASEQYDLKFFYLALLRASGLLREELESMSP